MLYYPLYKIDIKVKFIFFTEYFEFRTILNKFFISLTVDSKKSDVRLPICVIEYRVNPWNYEKSHARIQITYVYAA